MSGIKGGIDFSLKGYREFRDQVMQHIETRYVLPRDQILMMFTTIGLIIYEPAADDITRRRKRDMGTNEKTIDLNEQFSSTHVIGKKIALIERKTYLPWLITAELKACQDISNLRTIANQRARQFSSECTREICNRISRDLRFIVLGLLNSDVKPSIQLYQFIHIDITCDRLMDGLGYSEADKKYYSTCEINDLISKRDRGMIDSDMIEYVSQVSVYARRYVNIMGRGSSLLRGEVSSSLKQAGDTQRSVRLNRTNDDFNIDDSVKQQRATILDLNSTTTREVTSNQVFAKLSTDNPEVGKTMARALVSGVPSAIGTAINSQTAKHTTVSGNTQVTTVDSDGKHTITLATGVERPDIHENGNNQDPYSAKNF